MKVYSEEKRGNDGLVYAVRFLLENEELLCLLEATPTGEAP